MRYSFPHIFRVIFKWFYLSGVALCLMDCYPYNIGLLSLQYLYVSRLSGLPFNCMITKTPTLVKWILMMIIQVLVLKSLSGMNDCEHRIEYPQETASFCVRQNAYYLRRSSVPRVYDVPRLSIADVISGFRRHVGLTDTLGLDVMLVSIRCHTRCFKLSVE